MGATRKTLGEYEILRPIGAGGMGEVYSAHDPSLGRKVAIKMLPVRLASDPETLSRFTQEARSASALNHPNIVTIHDVGAAESSPFIVMEYIDGQDLRSVIRDRALPMRKVLDIAAQIADGLAAAHERGIVHRDLKPENIMVTRDGYAKILDFGLAKVVTAVPEGDDTVMLDAAGTNPGTILGTVGYMSPEQATGRRLDFRSDQFAFGAIVYELVTGKPAFQRENAVDTLSAILHEEPEPIARLVPRAPVQLGDVVSRLLEKSPDDRYSSTRDLARELRLLRDRVVAEESGFHSSSAVVTKPRRVIPIVGAFALAIFLAGVVFIARERTSAKPTVGASAAAPAAEKKYLAVMRFNDLTGDANGRLVVDGFAETLTARLAHYPALQVMRPPASEAAPADPRKAARDLGANLVLTGSMMRNRDRIRVTYSVLEPRTGREWRDLVEGNVANLFAVQDDVAESVARNLDLGTALGRIAIDPAVSQQRYLEALGHLRRYDDDESIDNAIGILEELGPSPTVQAALARAFLHKFENTREPRFAAAAGAAAERALRADPQSVDVNITLGELRRKTGRYDESVAAFLRVLSQQPTNAEAVLGLAETYKASGDTKSAEEAYKRAIELQPNYWGGYNKLGAFYYTLGRYNDAVPQFRKVVELVPDNERGYNNLGGMYQRLGQYDRAVAVFQESIQRKPSGQGYSNLGTCYYFLGRREAAAEAFENAVRLAPHDFVYWRNLGDAYRWIPGREEDARRAFERAVELARDTIHVNPSESYAHMVMGAALAKLRRDREARAAILRALEMEPRNPGYLYEAAVVANIAGAEDEAAARLEQALRLGYNPVDAQRDPEFANLAKSGRLEAIIQQSRSTTRDN